jgi:lipopolysaccharide biosynthesis regulator YciM
MKNQKKRNKAKLAIRLINILFFLLLSFPVFSQASSDQQLAAQYFQSGEFDKAALYYEKLYSKKPTTFYYNYLLKCQIELKDYKSANKLIKKHMKNEPGNPIFYIDLGSLNKLEGDEDESLKNYDKVLKEMSGNANQAQALGAAFKAKEEFGYALKVYEKADKLLNGTTPFNIFIADIYLIQGEFNKAIDQYILLAEKGETYISQAQNVLAINVNFEHENNSKVDYLKSELLKKVQKDPGNEIYNEMLIWFYKQKNDYATAFIQVKALDKRKNQIDRVFQFAQECKNNDKLDIAQNAFTYIIDKGNNGNSYYVESRMELVDVLFKKVVSRGIYEETDLLALEQNYIDVLSELGRNAQTVNLVKGLAKIEAFYMQRPDSAIVLLEEALTFPGLLLKTQAEIKLDLADVLLLNGDVWESSLYYSQVEKSFKNDVIGHEAKFRNAKISYFTGDFNWARAQLDVLKKSTSKLIANDAMQLSLLISDNLTVDSLFEPLQMYSRADLKLFRNDTKGAEKTLDTLAMLYSWHSLADEIHYMRFRIAKQEKNFEKAVKELTVVSDQFSFDILADDALFNLAEIFHYYYKDEEKAAEYYKRILFDHPGSLYVIEARKRFRIIRGEGAEENSGE